MYHAFSVAETIKTAWNILKKNFSVIAVYSIIAFVVILGFAFLIYNLLTDEFIISIGILVLLVGVSFIFLGFIKLVFQLMDKEFYEFDFTDIVPGLKMLFSYIVLLILVSTLSIFMTNAIHSLSEGWAQSLFGIFIGLFFQFFFLFYFPICTCFIVDDESGPFESIKQSYQLIKGNFLKYLLLFILIESIIFLGSITVIGMLFAMPFVNILLVAAYRKLIYSHQDVDDDIAETI